MDLNRPATLESGSHCIVQPPVPRPLKKLYQGEPLALGITQIFIGILQIAFGLVIVRAEPNNYLFVDIHIVIPYWMAIMYIISGSLSVAAAKKPQIPLVKGMLGMNVVSSMAAGVGILLFISGHIQKYQPSCGGYRYPDVPPELCKEYIVIPYFQIHNMTIVLLVFTILEFLIAIITAAFGCATLCRNNFSESTVVIFQNTAQETTPTFLTPVKEDEVPEHPLIP